MEDYLLDAVTLAEYFDAFADICALRESILDNYLDVCLGNSDWREKYGWNIDQSIIG